MDKDRLQLPKAVGDRGRNPKLRSGEYREKGERGLAEPA